MSLLEKTKKICEENNIRPARSKGQNFLIEEGVYDQIVLAADLKNTDIVLEVGPGLGFLTNKLSEKAGQIVAVELDDKLAAYLQNNFKKENIKIINENILDFNFAENNFKVVANLPYNITSVFIRKMLTSQNKPREMILMLQKEVAERICAKPGDMSLLALSVQFYAKPEIIFQVPRTAFYPVPAVDSAIIKIALLNNQTLIDKEKEFFRLAKMGFSAKRKMLKNNLANGLHISNKEAEDVLVANELNVKTRAEDLSVDDWTKLAQKISFEK